MLWLLWTINTYINWLFYTKKKVYIIYKYNVHIIILAQILNFISGRKWKKQVFTRVSSTTPQKQKKKKTQNSSPSWHKCLYNITIQMKTFMMLFWPVRPYRYAGYEIWEITNKLLLKDYFAFLQPYILQYRLSIILTVINYIL